MALPSTPNLVFNVVASSSDSGSSFNVVASSSDSGPSFSASDETTPTAPSELSSDGSDTASEEDNLPADSVSASSDTTDCGCTSQDSFFSTPVEYYPLVLQTLLGQAPEDGTPGNNELDWELAAKINFVRNKPIARGWSQDAALEEGLIKFNNGDNPYSAKGLPSGQMVTLIPVKGGNVAIVFVPDGMANPTPQPQLILIPQQPAFPPPTLALPNTRPIIINLDPSWRPYVAMPTHVGFWGPNTTLAQAAQFHSSNYNAEHTGAAWWLNAPIPIWKTAVLLEDGQYGWALLSFADDVFTVVTVVDLAGAAVKGGVNAIRGGGSTQLVKPMKMPKIDHSLPTVCKPGEYLTDGYTTLKGDVFLRPGLTRPEQIYTLNHESVHVFFTPKGTGAVTTIRQYAGMYSYRYSALLQSLEEALAETYASGSLKGGLAHAFNGGYSTPFYQVTQATAAGELVLYVGGVGAASYGAYQGSSLILKR
jgi:hypothetical protein